MKNWDKNLLSASHHLSFQLLCCHPTHNLLPNINNFKSTLKKDIFMKINVIDLLYGPGADGSPPLPPHPPQGKWQAAAFAAPDKIDLFNSASHVYVFGWIFK